MDIAELENMDRLKFRYRVWLLGFIVGLIVSGLTAFWLDWEVRIVNDLIGEGTFMEKAFAPMAHWITRVHVGLDQIQREQPYIFYGTDWLAFGHLVIATAFLGPLKDPVRNKWVIDFGIIACIMVIPLALICGPVRGIPFFWQMIDCSFGIFGLVPLLICKRYACLMETGRN
jgi:hypothetical protein